MTTQQLIILACVGVVSGFVNALAGGGSAIPMAMMLAFGLPPNVVNGTNRLGSLALSLAGMPANQKKGGVPLTSMLKPMLLALPFAALGVVAAAYWVPHRWMELLLWVAIAGAALMMFIQSRSEVDEAKPRHWLSLTFAGFYCGLLQAGAGIVFLLGLIPIYKGDLLKANQVKLALVFVVNSAAVTLFAWRGEVDWRAGLAVASGSAIGAIISFRVAHKLSKKHLRMVVGSLVLCVVMWRVVRLLRDLGIF